MNKRSFFKALSLILSTGSFSVFLAKPKRKVILWDPNVIAERIKQDGWIYHYESEPPKFFS